MVLYEHYNATLSTQVYDKVKLTKFHILLPLQEQKKFKLFSLDTLFKRGQQQQQQQQHREHNFHTGSLSWTFTESSTGEKRLTLKNCQNPTASVEVQYLFTYPSDTASTDRTLSTIRTLNFDPTWSPTMLSRRLDETEFEEKAEAITMEISLLERSEYEETKGNDKEKISTRLTSDFQGMFDSMKHSDVVFVFGSEELKAHKAILAARSPVFSAMFEHDMIERRTNRVRVEDIQLHTFEMMLNFMYTGKTLSKWLDEAPRLLAAACKYQLHDLKQICEESLVRKIDCQNVCRYLVLADATSAHLLKDKALTFIIRNLAAVVDTQGYRILLRMHTYLTTDILNKMSVRHERVVYEMMFSRFTHSCVKLEPAPSPSTS